MNPSCTLALVIQVFDFPIENHPLLGQRSRVDGGENDLSARLSYFF